MPCSQRPCKKSNLPFTCSPPADGSPTFLPPLLGLLHGPRCQESRLRREQVKPVLMIGFHRMKSVHTQFFATNGRHSIASTANAINF